LVVPLSKYSGAFYEYRFGTWQKASNFIAEAEPSLRFRKPLGIAVNALLFGVRRFYLLQWRKQKKELLLKPLLVV